MLPYTKCVQLLSFIYKGNGILLTSKKQLFPTLGLLGIPAFQGSLGFSCNGNDMSTDVTFISDASCSDQDALAQRPTQFVPSPFVSGPSALLKSFYRTRSFDPEQLVENLAKWAVEEQQLAALQRQRLLTEFGRTAGHPMTLRMLCGKLVSPCV